MRIAFFSNYYHPVVNGVVRSVSSFRQALTGIGHTVFVFAQDDDIKDQEPFIFRYPSLNLPISADIPAVIPVSPCVDWMLPQLKLDIVHTHHPILLGQTGAVKAGELDVPLVFTFHTQYREYTHYLPIPQEAVQTFVRNTITTWLKAYMRQCHHIIIPSNSMLEILKSEYGLTNHFSVIPTGIDLMPFRQANGKRVREEHGWQNEKVILSVGRLAEEKNQASLLRAVALTSEKIQNLRLVLIGDGPQRDELQKLAQELQISHKVTFIGEIPFTEIPDYLKAGDLFGFASLTETQGLVTMEALAAGLPVVAVKASGTKDIIEDGKQGLLVENSFEALGAGFKNLLKDQSTMEKFHRAALKKAEQFDLNQLALKMVAAYEQATAAKQAQQFVEVEE